MAYQTSTVRPRYRLQLLAAAIVSLACSLLNPVPCHAGNQARGGINLGLTSFFDGFGRPIEGFTYQGYLYYGRGRKFYDALGNENRAFRNPEFDVFLFLNQLSYTLPTTLFGGRARPAFNFILPITGYHTSFGTGGPVLTSNRTGIGDLTAGPMLQFLPLIVGGRPVFSQRIEFDLIAPIGRFDPAKNINQGSNFISLNPYWAATVLPLPGLEFTARVNYIYNFTNERPVNAPVDRTGAKPMPLPVESARAGQTIWVNFAVSYEVLKSLHLGVNGYYLKQLTLDRFNLTDGSSTSGKEFGEGKQQVLGIGPGVFWEANKTEKLYANVTFPTMVEARWAQPSYQIRWVHNFGSSVPPPVPLPPPPSSDQDRLSR